MRLRLFFAVATLVLFSTMVCGQLSKQAHEFLFKVSFLVMLSLIADVTLNIGDA
jgi:hypothetical protein